ncbi:MAG: sodium/proline symporter [Thermoanaerobaculales bacterium]|nr:sodium/proline symporter [Thermoanaerobaculales bacterium]
MTLTGTTMTIGGVMFAYLGILLIIGWVASRRTHGGEDFHLAGRSLGAWTAGISSTASSESGWVTLGAVGMTYAYGVSGLWFAPGCLLGYLVNVYVVAPRLRRLSADQGSMTLTDVITRRWGDPQNVLRMTATTITLLCMMVYVASQMTAAGKAFSTTLGLGEGGYFWGVVIGAAVITVVTLLGGFRAVAWTDLFQGLLVAFGIVLLPLYAVFTLGGFGALFAGLGHIDPALLTADGGRIGPALWGFIIGELGIGLGYPGMPHVVTRYMAARNEIEVRRLRVIAMLWGVTVFYGAGLAGLVGRVMLPNLVDGERALIALSLELLHPVLAGLLLAAVISAILSTVSSQLLVAASAVSYDLVEQTFGKAKDDRRSLFFGRLTVAFIGLLGILVALRGESAVFWFVLFAWSGLGASFAPLTLMALRPRLINRYGAMACMLTGTGVTIIWKLGIKNITDPTSIGPLLFGRLWWMTLVVAAVILLLGRAAQAFDAGHSAAVLTACLVTLAAWWLVQHWGMHNLYELVPAFVLATAAALVVSRVVMEKDEG